LRLQTGADYTQRIPLDVCAGIMGRISPLFVGSLRMAIEGASVASGRPPAWLERASDVRFVDYSHDRDDTLIALGLPRLGDAAAELYRQGKLWDTRPNPDDTAVEVFRHVVDEVAAENYESSWYDRQLLTRLARMKKVFGSQIHAIALPSGIGSTRVNEKVTETAARLGASTPATRQVRIAGVLDMIRHSTRSFSLRLESGEEVHGVMESADGLTALPEFFGKPVLVLGRAVYRPSGRLLRIDAAGIEDGAGASPLFSKIPPPQTVRPSASGRWRISETGRRGVPAFFGTWPGDETDADMDMLVKDIRGSGSLVH
jgi:hypothetical protein